MSLGYRAAMDRWRATSPSSCHPPFPLEIPPLSSTPSLLASSSSLPPSLLPSSSRKRPRSPSPSPPPAPPPPPPEHIESVGDDIETLRTSLASAMQETMTLRARVGLLEQHNVVTRDSLRIARGMITRSELRASIFSSCYMSCKSVTMTRKTVKKLTKPLDKLEREFRRLRKAAMRSHQNESPAIVGRNLFDDKASSSNNTGAKPSIPPKTLHKHSRPNPSAFQNPITFPTEQTRRIVDSCDIWLIQSTCTFHGLRNVDPLCHVKHYLSIVDNIQADGATRDTSRKLDQFTQFRFSSLTEEEGWNRVEEYVQYQDDLWDEPSPSMNVSSILEAMQPTLRGRLKRACNHISFLEAPTREVGLKNPYLIYDYCKGSHEADECSIRKTIPHHGRTSNVNKREKKAPNGLLEILLAINKSETLEPEAPTFAITTRSGISTQDPPFSAAPQLATDNFIEGKPKKKGIFELKPTRRSIQLADRYIKYPVGFCENLLVKVNKFVFPVDFVVLEIDEDELVPVILG
nr:hypothetical protein [Tanacetum cinerariifolium]